tara:strand:+ start:981 stop:1268 length:288 start_codon:yes stop_codon:yes gene_type:complete
MRYLILKYYTKPNGKIDESMTVAKNLKPRDLQEASIILDFKLQKVEKCNMNGNPVPKVWDTVVSYYYQHYTSIIERLFEENGHKIDVKVEPRTVK